MATDPRRFTVPDSDCARSVAIDQSLTNERRDFFGALGKIGDVEALNAIGGGKIGAGLRTLESLSDTIRVGDSAVPSSFLGGSLDKAANFVFDQTGIDNTFVQSVSNFNPGVANRALNSAKDIAGRVKDGRFKVSDLPNALQELQNLEILGTSIFSPSGQVESIFQSAAGGPVCASAYAVDLVQLAPKYKFLFAVEFVFSPDYEQETQQNGARNVTAALCKQFARPQIQFEYEDVNIYNFRTKVRKMATYQPMELQFYDDIKNHTMDFFVAYLNAISPSTNLDSEDYFGGTKVGAEERGMDFAGKLEQRRKRYAASIGPLTNNSNTFLKQINLFHLFDFGRFMNVYRYFRPKMVEINFDELSMEDGSTGNMITSQFAYDSVFFERRARVGRRDNSNKIREISDLGGIYPLRHVGQPVIESSDTVTQINRQLAQQAI